MLKHIIFAKTVFYIECGNKAPAAVLKLNLLIHKINHKRFKILKILCIEIHCDKTSKYQRCHPRYINISHNYYKTETVKIKKKPLHNF